MLIRKVHRMSDCTGCPYAPTYEEYCNGWRDCPDAYTEIATLCNIYPGKGGEKVLNDKFFEEYTKTGPPPQEAAADEPEKMYTAAEVDKLVADKVEAAVKEIKSSMANNPDIPEHEEGEE